MRPGTQFYVEIKYFIYILIVLKAYSVSCVAYNVNVLCFCLVWRQFFASCWYASGAQPWLC